MWPTCQFASLYSSLSGGSFFLFTINRTLFFFLNLRCKLVGKLFPSIQRSKLRHRSLDTGHAPGNLDGCAERPEFPTILDTGLELLDQRKRGIGGSGYFCQVTARTGGWMPASTRRNRGCRKLSRWRQCAADWDRLGRDRSRGHHADTSGFTSWSEKRRKTGDLGAPGGSVLARRCRNDPGETRCMAPTRIGSIG